MEVANKMMKSGGMNTYLFLKDSCLLLEISDYRNSPHENMRWLYDSPCELLCSQQLPWMTSNLHKMIIFNGLSTVPHASNSLLSVIFGSFFIIFLLVTNYILVTIIVQRSPNMNINEIFCFNDLFFPKQE